MSFELFEKLEARVQQLIDTIDLLQMELDDLKEKNKLLSEQNMLAEEDKRRLNDENVAIRAEQGVWQERLRILLDKMDDVKPTE